MSIDVTVEDHVALITINRPERMNALDHEHYKALSDAWIRVRDVDNIRAAIVTGAGERAFCAGADTKSLLPKPTELSEMWLTQNEQILNRGLEVWKPIIAAVNGVCMGGGTCMMFATDICSKRLTTTPSASAATRRSRCRRQRNSPSARATWTCTRAFAWRQ